MAASGMRSCTVVAEAAAQIVFQKLDTLLSHPVCVECLWMQARVEDAKVKLATIQDFVSAQYRPSQTTEWSGRLLRTMHYAEEFIDEFQLREARKRNEALHLATWPLVALISKYKLWRDLSILVNKMEGLCDEKFLKEGAEGKRNKEPASSSSHVSVPWQGQKLARLTGFWDQYQPTIFLNVDAKKKEIMERIKAKPTLIQGTSIWAGQGAGKMILARFAYDQAKYMDYEPRVWVHVSASMDKREFLLKILKQVEELAREMKDMDIKEINKMLYQKLVQKKRFLIVLDGVQPSNEPLLRELAMRMPLSSQGHIITTTEDYKIAKCMNTSGAGPIELENLDGEESQKMLAWKLHGVLDSQRLSIVEKNILNICPRLPLCIALLGGFLSKAGEQERAALVKEGSKMTLLDMLKLSCHKLPVHLKPCFIYMALFPVGFPIPTRRLVRLWLAEGLLDSHCYDVEREMKRQPEDVGETFILELADRNMIQVMSRRADGSPKACRLQIPLHDMIRRIAMSMGFLHIHATSESKDIKDRDPTSQQQQLPAHPQERTKIRWLAEHTNIVTDIHGGSYPDLSHIRSFLSFYQRRGVLTKDMSTFLRKVTSKTDYSWLRVLDLEGVYKPSLQDVLHKLVLLRYLGLRSTLLDTLPITIADLHHLETLDIKHTNITSLPSSLWKARNGLVIGEVKENSMTSHTNSLTTLTTLKLFLRHSDKDTSGAAGKTVADWISFRLTNLQSLTFGVIQEAKPAEEAMKVAQPVAEAQPAKEIKPEPAKEAKPANEAENKAKPARSQIGLLPELSLADQHHDLLELYLLGQLNKPSWKQLLPISLRVLTLSGSKLEGDIMTQLGGLMRLLRTFRLLANSFLGTRLTFAKDGFPSLKFLKIWKLPKLEEVIIEEGAMLHLKELELRHLNAMKNVIGIKECKELKTIRVVVEEGACDFGDHLEDVKGKTTNLYITEEVPELMDDNEDDRYVTILNLKHYENVVID
ncbi:hypothetical protein BT93_L0435 [Corymbia citriodora subsp. variegata]|uniref:NB-ARC domain-containing protein n=1 Tax=Corymbia citriodora subsp. variegata TaxID=360336 RepID=A0A8T0CPY3_CORYI|nr:hypothetical protein BT93_L0435 [Corymbia citriodora subsp. variegata]